MITVRPYHQALTTINLDNYTNTLDEACHRALTIINLDHLNTNPPPEQTDITGQRSAELDVSEGAEPR